jgi:A/G-specific adenine glycosylase
MSFAYGEAAPVLDTNVRRILTRVFVARRPSAPGALDRRLWALAEAVVPRGDAWAFNQALMDLGAMICRARHPDCPACPVQAICHRRSRANTP